MESETDNTKCVLKASYILPGKHVFKNASELIENLKHYMQNYVLNGFFNFQPHNRWGRHGIYGEGMG